MFKSIKYIASIGMIIIFVLTLTIAFVSAENMQMTDIEVFFDNILDSKLEQYHIPNATVAVVKEGEIIFNKGFGYADIENSIPVDADNTLFRIGSTSKLITWTAVMQLVEAGKLDLNTDVNTYLDFEIPPKVINSPKKGTVVEPITLTHLMTHTPGFEDYPDQLFRISEEGRLPLNEYIKKYLPSRIFPAGEVAAYSNYGTALAGYIVERVSGLPFAEYVEKNIFLPLEMTNSTFRQPLSMDLSPRIAKPYRSVQGSFVEGGFEYILPEPAGSMSSTASDMARFMMAHLGGDSIKEKGILRKESLEKMHLQHFTHHSDLGGMTLGFMEGAFNNRRVIFHSGGTMLYSTGLYLLPEENMGVFISYSGGDHLLHSEVFQTFMDSYYPTVAAINVAPKEGSKERGKKFIGEYQMNRRSVTTIEKSSSLFMGIIQVATDEDGYLLVTNLGETNRFYEIEPGVYQNLREGRTQDYFGPFNKIVFKTDPYGRLMLTTDGPMTYSKAPLYSTTSFTVVALLVILIILLVSFIYWIIIKVLGLFKQRKTKNSRFLAMAQWTGMGFSMIVMLLFASILSSGNNDPIYLLPKEAYIPVEASLLHQFLPTAMITLGLVLVGFTVMSWRKGWCRKLIRIHYTLYTMSALGLMLILNYWNLFK